MSMSHQESAHIKVLLAGEILHMFSHYKCATAWACLLMEEWQKVSILCSACMSPPTSDFFSKGFAT